VQQDEQIKIDEDTVEPEVGMMVSVSDSVYWGEIIAIRRSPDMYQTEEYYHVAYASGTGVKLACFRHLSNLKFQPIGEATSYKCTVSDMLGSQKTSKYGSIADVAEAALDFEVDPNPLSVGTKGVARLRQFCVDQGLYGSYLSNYLTPYIHMASAEEGGSNISLYLTSKDRKRDRLTSMKPGRAFRHMFPNADDTKISSATEAWIEYNQTRDLTLVVGKERVDFRNAYNGIRGDYRNPACTFNRKSIATSCMQGVDIYDTNRDAISPAEAYASGDFEIAYLTNGKGGSNMRIFGRVVFAPNDKSKTYLASGPVYGACEQSLDLLHKYLVNRAKEEGHSSDEGDGVEFDIDFGWRGLRLLTIYNINDNLVGPYIDGDIQGSLEGGYITLGEYGDYSFESTDGTIEQGCRCDTCGDTVNEDELYQMDDETLCEHCFNQSYVFLENGDTVHIDEAVHANSYDRRYTRQGWYLLDEVVHCECVDEYWVADDCTYAELTDQYVPNKQVDQFPELFNEEEEEEEEAA